MSAEDLRVGTTNLVCQASGVQIPPYGPTPYPPNPNEQVSVDANFFCGDIGVLWDMGDGRTGILYGDCYGSGWNGGFDVPLNPLSAQRTVNAAQPSRDITTLAGVIDVDTILMFNVGGLAAGPGYASISGGGITGPGGWAVVRYQETRGGATPYLNGVEYVCGSGTLDGAGVAQRVHTGDPRTHGGLRGNLLATSSTTDLGSGMEIDTFLTHADGTAIEPFPFPQTTQAIEDVYPQIDGGPGTSIGVLGIARTSGYVTVTTSTPHGLPVTGSNPRSSGPPVYIEDVPSKQATLTGMWDSLGNPTVFTANAATIGVAHGFGFVGSLGTATQRRVAVQTFSGACIFEYTDATPTQLTGCTPLSGNGVAGAGAYVIQGWDRYPIPGSTAPIAELVTNRDWVIFDVPSTTTFRILNAFYPNRAGGIYTGCTVHLPNVTDTADLVTSRKVGLFPVGACSVPEAGATSGFRQVAVCFNSFYNGAFAYNAGCELWYSDDGGDATTWTRSTADWANTPEQSARVQGFAPYYDADNNAGFSAPHVIAVGNPALILMRVLPGDILDKSAWEYWTGGDPTSDANWSSDEADSQHLGWTDWSGAANGSVTSFGLAFHPGLSVWVASFSIGLQNQVRFSDDLITWGPARRLTDGSDFGNTNGYTYGGFVHPLSGVAPQAADSLYTIHTLLLPYQLMMLRSEIVDPGGVDNEVVDSYTKLRMKPGGGLAEWDSWMSDTHVWVRTGNHQFTVETDPNEHPLGATWLKPGTKVSYDDGDGSVDYGVVGSVSFAADVTTVNLIVNTDHVMAAATIEDRRYSHADCPPGFPSAFNWTPTLTGYSVAPSSAVYQWVAERSGWITITIREAVVGTKDATATAPTYSLPITAKTVANGLWWGQSVIAIGGAAPLGAVQTNAAALGVGSAATSAVAYSSYAPTNTWSPSASARVGAASVRYPFA